MQEKHIYERKGKKGLSYQIIIRYGKPRKTFTKTINVADFPSKSIALNYAKQVRNEKLLDIIINKNISKIQTVQDIYNMKFALFSNNIKTRAKHDSIYNQCIKPYADKLITDITSADIQISLNNFAKTHSQDATNRAKTIWHQIFTTAQMQGINITDKTLGLKIKSTLPNNPKPTTISHDDFFKFLSAIDDYNVNTPDGLKMAMDIKYMLLIMYYTGCRPAEALALSKDDININENILSINKAIGSDDNEPQQITNTKTKSSIRNIPITPDLKIILTNLLEYSSTTPLLTDKHGKPYHIDYVSGYISRISKKCGIRFNSYMLRHLFSSDLFQQGTSPIVIRDLMGHSSAKMSSDYANANETDKSNALINRKCEQM